MEKQKTKTTSQPIHLFCTVTGVISKKTTFASAFYHKAQKTEGKKEQMKIVFFAFVSYHSMLAVEVKGKYAVVDDELDDVVGA